MQESKDYVICKKIAQLTRVVFFLNLKNDEYEQNLQSVVQCYEGEMDSIVGQCNSILLTHKKEIAELQAELQQEQSQKGQLLERVRLEKAQSQKAFEEFAQQSQLERQQAGAVHERRLREQQQEVAQLHQKLTEFSGSLATVVRKKDERIAALEGEHHGLQQKIDALQIQLNLSQQEKQLLARKCEEKDQALLTTKQQLELKQQEQLAHAQLQKGSQELEHKLRQVIAPRPPFILSP